MAEIRLLSSNRDFFPMHAFFIAETKNYPLHGCILGVCITQQLLEYNIELTRMEGTACLNKNSTYSQTSTLCMFYKQQLPSNGFIKLVKGLFFNYVRVKG